MLNVLLWMAGIVGVTLLVSFVVDRIDAWIDYKQHGTHGRRYYGPGWGDNY